ncbi:flavin reductase family protein [Halocynthiibacter sp. C4]|uniref:flavin reductase family protein n=1 Tax=Halocynthiibacter sp. C4 TaxID=2992758 RepID=UPI00237B9D60|nr:flavin reductase family protein [Halocynthiibacter sp. C4]MDE0590931.1 flavin reductase family protein [Halocynthiibacter sp. C4]
MSDSFVPDDDSDLKLRAAFGQFATGITVVTARSDTGPIGITVNSFSSVSLDPPLALWSLAKDSFRANSFLAAKSFAIHVLSSDQGHLARRFAQSAESFDGLAFDTNENGVPLLRDCLSRFECTLHESYAGGDHTIIVGRIKRVSRAAGKPLLFYGGAYGEFRRLGE